VAEILIRQSSAPGELVIDPFVGSGFTGVAAARLGRRFLGNDVCAEAVAAAERRLLAAGSRRDRALLAAVGRSVAATTPRDRMGGQRR